MYAIFLKVSNQLKSERCCEYVIYVAKYEDRSQGFLSSVFFKKSKKDIKKETTGYFNKVSPIGEQHYSTTSSEEYW